MFDILFGWRKASKCKKLIRRIQCRLKLLKNKRGSIIRYLREDVAQLLKIGQEQSAFSRVEQLFQDQSIMTAYELLDHFCEFIIIHLPYIRRHRDCPNDINEAVSSLIYAAARCGDLPELQMLRKLFGERYGQKFAMASAELLPGNLVNHQIIEKLCIKSVTDNLKLRLLDDIVRDYNLQLGPLGIADRFELLHQQVYDLSVENRGCQREGQVSERDIQVFYGSTEGAYMQASNVEEVRAMDRPFNSSSNCKKLVTGQHQSNNLNSTSTSSSAAIIVQRTPDTVETLLSSPVHKISVKTEKQEEFDPSYKSGMAPDGFSAQSTSGSCSSSRFHNASPQRKVERITTGTASESSHQFPEVSIVYLDDVEEFRPTVKEDDKGKDQRLFMFKSTISPFIDNYGAGRASLLDLYGYSCTEDQIEICEPWDRKAHSRSSSKRRKSSRKRLKRRSLSRESKMYHSSMSLFLGMKDGECALYYGDPCDSPNEDLPCNRSLHGGKHQRKISFEEGRSSKFRSHEKKLSLPQQPYNTTKTQKEVSFGEMGGKHLLHECKYGKRRSYSGCSFNHNMAVDCSLDHPCYFLTSDDKDEVESPCWKQRGGITTLVSFPTRNIPQAEWLDDCCYRCCSPNEVTFNSTTMNHRSYGQAPDNKATIDNTKIQELGSDSSPQRDYQNQAAVFMDIQNHRNKKQSKNVESGGEELSDFQGSSVPSRGSCSRVTSPWTETLRQQPPYLRAMTMPPERPKDTPTDNILRSASCQFQRANHPNSGPSSSSSHIHPKLPEYDDFAAKFIALKKEHLQHSLNQVSNGLRRA